MRVTARIEAPQTDGEFVVSESEDTGRRFENRCLSTGVRTLIIGGSVVLEILRTSGLASSMASLIAPFVNGWLGLPAITRIPLIFGILRKELTLILLSEFAGTMDFSRILSPLQMVIFALITMIYVPCVATIAALVREFDWKRAMGVVAVDILLALLIGGAAYRILVAYIQ